MTKEGVIANRAFFNPIFIPLGGPQAHEHSGRDDKLGVTVNQALLNLIFISLGEGDLLLPALSLPFFLSFPKGICFPFKVV